MPNWVAVHGIGEESLTPETLNRPLIELTERTNYLKRQLDTLLDAGTYSSLVLTSVALETEGTLAPVVGDVVYLNPTSLKYEKAVASTVAGNPFGASNNSIPMGILSSIDSGLGTVVTTGKITLRTNDVGWGLDATNNGIGPMLEADEIFTNGPYYLSESEPGKLTSDPNGPVTYIGYFVADDSGFGDYAILRPQHHSLAEAHLHLSYVLASRPAGRHRLYCSPDPEVDICDVSAIPDPSCVHQITGYVADSGTATTAYLLATGAWTGQADAQYVIKIADAAGTGAPTSFADAYIHWSSSDTAEGSGSSRFISYEYPVSIGTKGLAVVIQAGSLGYSVPPTSATASTRTWTLKAPQQVRGWSTRSWRSVLAPATAKDYTLVLFGSTYAPATVRTSDTIKALCYSTFKVYTVDANMSDGDSIQVGAIRFEFDDDDAVTAGSVAVPIGADADATMLNLLFYAQEHFADNRFVVAYNRTAVTLTVGYETTLSVSATNLSLISTLTGPGDFGGTEPYLLFVDKDYMGLAITQSGYYDIIVLNNGLYAFVVPYAADGTAAVDESVSAEDSWTVDITDEAPGAKFVYHAAMQSDMAERFPPIPVESGIFVLNGVELDSADLFPTFNHSYKFGLQGVYWYPDTWSNVPWPSMWCSKSSNEETDNFGGLGLSDQYRGTVHVLRMQTNSGLVTSLRPKTGASVRVTRVNTDTEATSGDLQIDLEMSLDTADTNITGHKVVKGVNGSSLKLGPVVEQLLPGAGISLTSITAGAADGQGIVIVSSAAAYQGDFEEVALRNAKQELIGMFPYIRLLGWTTGGANNVPSAFVAKFKVPEVVVAGSVIGYRVEVYATVFGETAIPVGGLNQYAGLELTYSILPDYTALGAGNANNNLIDGMITRTTPLIANVKLGVVDSVEPTYDAYDPMLIHNSTSLVDTDRKQLRVLGLPFPTEDDATPPNGEVWSADDFVVKSGSLVGIQLSRGDVDGAYVAKEYTGAVGIINLRWKLVAVTA